MSRVTTDPMPTSAPAPTCGAHAPERPSRRTRPHRSEPRRPGGRRPRGSRSPRRWSSWVSTTCGITPTCAPIRTSTVATAPGQDHACRARSRTTSRRRARDARRSRSDRRREVQTLDDLALGREVARVPVQTTSWASGVTLQVGQAADDRRARDDAPTLAPDRRRGTRAAPSARRRSPRWPSLTARTVSAASRPNPPAPTSSSGVGALNSPPGPSAATTCGCGPCDARPTG